MERYVISGGRRGYDRLQVLARERWPTTAALLARAGLKSGMKVADLGCGGGQVTMELARIVAPAHVTGFDMDEVKLALAREAAAERGIDNVEFRAMNLHDWREPDAYGAVYTRFVLQHLRQPIEILIRMWEAVRPGGVLIVEDADFDGWESHPKSAALDFFLRTYAEAIRRSGGDHSIGRKLYAMFLEAGIPRPELTLTQPVYLEGEGKSLPWSTLEASAGSILAENIASRAEIDAALDGLSKLIDDTETLVLGPRLFHLWSRRPA
ncbi:MAG TPA: methyltransferase domain-containing protein [Candidatus Dormibacteraeota bacterium]|nr:methyltransferase domain-containing protein [Candidatus Dormibacteraeota bacterium]